MSSTDFPEPERESVPLDDLSTDDSNPNWMSDGEFQALKKNIKKFGFVVPVITNQEYVIADGEHRLRAARELGLGSIPAVVLDVDDPDRRILRQVLNKLRGDHDIHDDAHEFEAILSAGREKSDISELLGQSERSIDGVLEMLDESDSTDEHLSEIESHDTPQSDVDDTTDGTNDSAESLGSPDALDSDTMEFDHECPQCGYQFD